METPRGEPNGPAAQLPGRRPLLRAGFGLVALAVVGVDVYYVRWVLEQDGGDGVRPRVIFFTVLFAVIAVALVTATVTRREGTIELAIAAASALFCSGGLTIFSLGLAFLLLAICTLGLLAGIAVQEAAPASLARRHMIGRILAAITPIVVLLVGISVTH